MHTYLYYFALSLYRTQKLRCTSDWEYRSLSLLTTTGWQTV